MQETSFDDDVQVPETSSPNNKVLSSSPLKPTTMNNPTDQVSSFRDKFMFKPNMPAQNSVSSGSPMEQVAQLQKEFPEFSSTLIQAVYKSNSSDIANARSRLNRIKEQRTSWSNSSTSSRSKGGSTGRLNSITSSSATSTKITVNKPSSSIFDRYSNSLKRSSVDENPGFVYDPALLAKIKGSRNLELPPNITSDTKSKNKASKKRKLVRGSELDAAKNKMLEVNAKKLMDEGSAAEDEETDMEDQSGSDIEYEDKSSYVVNIDEQILEFLNTADALDIADLADTTFDKAKMIISKRPFSNLADFSSNEFLTEEEIANNAEEAEKRKKRTGRGYRGSQKKESEKFLEKINQSIRGYNAIDSLLKTCDSYGKSIESQMGKWGINIQEIEEKNKDDKNPSKDDNDGIALMTIDNDEEENGDGDDILNEVKNEDVVEEFDETEISATPTPAPSEEITDENKNNSGESDFEPDDLEEEEEYAEEEEDEDYEEIQINKRDRNSRSTEIKFSQRKGVVKYFKGKPRLLSPDIELKDYQQMGINWLNLLYHNQMSCILADDMGLGKTCQVISFLAYLKQINISGPNLIVVPSSTLENWLREFKKFCPALKVEPYYGSQQERADLREYLEKAYGQYDVIVTTYNLAAGNKYDVAFLKNSNFNVVVYDEGHMLKNSMSERFNKLMKIKANFRLLLTGTPLQNNLRELMSLLEFIMPSLFISKKDSLATVFKQKARTSDDNKDHNPLLVQEAIERAKTMMKPFILRRHKDQVLRHLPKKHSKIVMCDMNDIQRKIYNKEIKHVMAHRKQVREGNVVKDKRMDSKNLIMSLRKASIHPLLFRNLYDDSKIDKMSTAILSEPEYNENGNKQYIMEDMSYMTDFELHKLCRNFPKSLSKYMLNNDEWMQSGKIGKLVPILKDIITVKKEKVLIFSLFTQVLDILELVLSTLGFKFLRLDGSTQVNERQSLIDKFYEDKTIPIFILSTKAGGFGINLVCANNVIIFDQSFNPHDDRQAADRSHRVGQTKEVQVSTLITRDSIEEKIHQLAKNKLALDMHVSEDDKKGQDAMENKISDILEDIIYKEEQSTA